MKDLNLLCAELEKYGVTILDNNNCQAKVQDKLVNISIKQYINELNKKINHNKSIFDNLIKDILNLLNSPKQKDFPINKIDEKLFIFSLKDLYNFYLNQLLFHGYENSFVKREDFIQVLNKNLNSDIKEIDINVIKSLPDYKIALDWIYRVLNILSYVKKMLKFYLQKDKSKSILRQASDSNCSGVWCYGIDTPMIERIWSYDSTSAEITERDKDLKDQERYSLGMEAYHQGNVAEGFYWRLDTIKDEPFSWESRRTDSPYPTYNSVP